MTDRPDPDWSLAGTPLHDWLGRGPHEATIKAAENALTAENIPIIVGIFREPSDPVHRFASQQRVALRAWFRLGHPDLPGRMRFRIETQRDPDDDNGNLCKVAVVIYEPDYKPRDKKTSDGE